MKTFSNILLLNFVTGTLLTSTVYLLLFIKIAIFLINTKGAAEVSTECTLDKETTPAAMSFVHFWCHAPGTFGGRKLEISTGKFQSSKVFLNAA